MAVKRKTEAGAPAFTGAQLLTFDRYRERRDLASPARGQKGRDTKVSLPLWTPTFPLLQLWRPERLRRPSIDEQRSEGGTGAGLAGCRRKGAAICTGKRVGRHCYAAPARGVSSSRKEREICCRMPRLRGKGKPLPVSLCTQLPSYRRGCQRESWCPKRIENRRLSVLLAPAPGRRFA